MVAAAEVVAVVEVCRAGAARGGAERSIDRLLSWCSGGGGSSHHRYTGKLDGKNGPAYYRRPCSQVLRPPRCHLIGCNRLA
ncbi:hypothetical protein E2C01_011401 [Portunus trituberculatus]|uniref:Uncharacterized protein n=1 Tax=Portunus trituberculatus TaxID=210409 RepID=A0A5B7DBL1_PORTR|nr:hypothetical protein [Portunus trituberculatus]